MKNMSKILIIDDEKNVLDLYGQKFSLAGFNVITCDDATKAFDLAKKHQPDVVLVDIIMPKVDGYKITKLLKADPKTKKIPIVLLSNLGEKEDITRGILLGAEDYIPKVNLTPQEVVEKIKTFLKND